MASSSLLKCKGCGRKTNTTLSDFMDTWPDAEVCYSAIDVKTRRWVEGCGYEKASKVDKKVADRYIGRNAPNDPGIAPTVGRTTKAGRED